MKKLFIVSMVALSGLFCSAQNYVSGSLSYYNGSGTFCQQAMPTVELGVTVSKVSLGIAGGFTAFSKGDFYTEFRVSPTIWEKGRFCISGSLGAGYVFNKANQLLTEYGGGVAYSLSNRLSVGLFAGKYYFSGKTVASSATFTGVSTTVSF